MLHRTPLSGIDSAWFRMDRPANPMVIAGVMILGGRVSLRRFQHVIEHGFLAHERFRCRVAMDADTPFWEPDPYFDLGFHLKRAALPRRAGRKALFELVSDLMSTPLDRAHPLWQFHLVERYGKGSVIVARVHHCYADGIALVRVLLAMSDGNGDAAERARRADAEPESWFEHLPMGRALGETVKVGSTLLGGALDVLLHPTHVADYARQGMDIAGELATLALMPMDSATALKGYPTGLKHAAWGSRIPLRDFQAVAGGTGCSINDVVLCCVAGALREYLRARGESVEDKEFRVLVPVNLRPPAETTGMGNYFGLVAVLLPLGFDNPLERLYEVRRRMLALKGSKQAVVSLGVLGAVGMAPNAVQQSTLDLLASRASAVMTNLPGPTQPVRMAGAELKELIFWVPQSSTIGVGISVLSYAGAVQCGIVIDGNLANDPDDVADRFRDEFAKLLWVTLLSPWSGKPEPVARRTSANR